MTCTKGIQTIQILTMTLHYITEFSEFQFRPRILSSKSKFSYLKLKQKISDYKNDETKYFGVCTKWIFLTLTYKHRNIWLIIQCFFAWIHKYVWWLNCKSTTRHLGNWWVYHYQWQSQDLLLPTHISILITIGQESPLLLSQCIIWQNLVLRSDAKKGTLIFSKTLYLYKNLRF